MLLELNIMKCENCENEAKIRIPEGNLCNDCFINNLVERVKKELSGKIKENDKIFIDSEMAKIFFDKANNVSVKLVKNPKSNELEKLDHIVVTKTADDEYYQELVADAEKYIGENGLISGSNQHIFLFRTILDKEYMLAAKILGVDPKADASYRTE